MKDLDTRCREVFLMEDNEEVCDFDYKDNQLRLFMVDNEENCCWIYEPDMEERPEALDYILGKRTDFHD